MNKITIIGNLTRDPEKRTTNSGKTVCTFSVAVDRRGKVNGAKLTDYFRVNTWNGTAENCAAYLSKGRKVAVVGELQVNSYTDKDGVKKSSIDVLADEVEFLTRMRQPGEDDETDGFKDISPDDIPF